MGNVTLSPATPKGAAFSDGKFARGLAAAGAGLLGGCEGRQAVLAAASPDGEMIARLGLWMFVSAAFILVVTLGLLAVALTLARGREARPLSRRGSCVLVISGGVLSPVAAIVALSISGVAIGDQTEGAGETRLTVEVQAKRWWWAFHYLDADGREIAVTANELHLPAGERTRLILTSDNVIHSFWVPNLQGKTDMIPGQRNVLFAEPSAPGRWRGQCAEFCGLQHALMGVEVVAEPRPAFDRWLARQAGPARVTEGPGLAAFMSQGCGECHALRGTPARGRDGPDLTHLAGRARIAAATLPNSRGALGGWITDTHRVKPGALMPASTPDPRELSDLLDLLEALE
ncbi:cytochrome c oxidase subunit II [Frigidibacter sp. MR17.24]|uniref:cytochrome c oxidase subunit II n=1 Tax=Frigidibacter sp. MR17.24 TaxID=3127345 RepID=UPI00301301FC